MLESKNVIITGGSRGLGYQLAEAFINDGHNVLICAKNEKELSKAYSALKKISTKDQLVLHTCCDISNLVSVVGLFKIAREKFNGKLDILINNAAILGHIGDYRSVDLYEWKVVFETNFFGAIQVTREAIPLLKNSKCAHIINIGSSAAYTPDPKFCQYAASKGALLSSTLSLSEELKSKKIAVNYVMPGGMATSMNEEKIRVGSRILGKKLHDAFVERKLTGKADIIKSAEFILKLSQADPRKVTGKILSARHDDVDLITKKLNKDLYLLQRRH